jgi:prophage regulatory protein
MSNQRKAALESKRAHQAAVGAAPAILRRPAVEARTGLSRSELYRRVRAGAFPAPLLIGKRSVGWLSSAIDSWIARMIAADKRGAKK